MYPAFWKSASVLLRYPRQLFLALLGALISAGCFGAGLGMILPALHLLLHRRFSLPQLLEQQSRLAPGFARALVHQIAIHVSNDLFWSFLTVMAVIAVFAIIGSLGRFMHEAMSVDAVTQAITVWRDRLFDRLVHMPMMQVLQAGTADNISRLMSDTGVLFTGYKAVVGGPMLESLKGAAGLTVAFIINWRLTLIALAATPLIGLLMGAFAGSIRRASQRGLEQSGRMIGTVQQSLLGIAVVKIHSAEEHERQRFDFVNRMVSAEQKSMGLARAAGSPLVEAFSLLVLVTMASAAAWYIFRLDVDPANFITVLITLVVAAQSLTPLTRLSHELAESDAAAVRLLEVLAQPVEDTEGAASDKPALPRHSRSIIFEGVSLSYPGRNGPAIRNANLTVSFGQTVAIVGPNGSGKTTLLSLVPRLFDPERGHVLIDGVDIAQVSLNSLRRQIGLVPQENCLFQGTIAANIAYGLKGVGLEKITAAAQAAYADEFIRFLPHGYETELGELGIGLSAGQKQRLAIARAILRDPAILILDEATSQIDIDSEEKINRVLRNLRGGRTVFVVAHHLRNTIDADVTVVLEDGQIIDTGTHKQLLIRCPLYRRLTANTASREHKPQLLKSAAQRR